MKYDLVLLDASAIIYRAFYGMPRHFMTSKGEPTNAVYGFTTSLFRIIAEFCDERIAVAYDMREKTFRHKAYEDYKATRVKAPDELYVQIPRTREVLDAFRIPYFEEPGFEADDIIGTLARKFCDTFPDKHVLIVSGDHDLLQLVHDHVSVAVFKGGFREFTLYDTDAVVQKLGVTPEQVSDLKALQGDASDNIPGVPGVGAKTAVALMSEFKTLENLYLHVDDISGRAKEKVKTYREQAFLSKDLATIECDVPISIVWDDIVWPGVDQGDAEKLFDELEFKSLRKKVLSLQHDMCDSSLIEKHSVTPPPEASQQTLF